MLAQRWLELWDTIRHGEARVPARVAIPADHVIWGPDEEHEPFRPDEHYFVVRVNEMFLDYSRQWFSVYDPMVLVVSEFTYDTEDTAVPFVVGPSLLAKHGQEAPNGMVFSDTRVAGLHPYRGGRLTLAVVLSRVQRENYASKFLTVLEGAAGVLDFATALTTYVKVAGVVLDGVQSLFQMGNGTKPIVGYRKEFDPEAGDVLGPGYFALIDADEMDVDLDKLWVRDHQLWAGDSSEASKPFRDADFVLYSIVRANARTDERTLPFYPLFQRMQKSASSDNEADWQRAKADMSSLWQTLVLSPDLTTSQAKQLKQEYRATLADLLKQSREDAAENATLGAGDDDTGPDLAELREAAEILDL
jgi:hypothetical protein